MNTRKTRHQFYLPDDLSETLEALARKPGASKTTVLTEALRAFIDRKGTSDLDERFAPRLDRQQRLLQRVEATLNISTEMLDLFVRHQLTIVAHQPPFDRETAQLGATRYQAFVDQVGRSLAAHEGQPRLIATQRAGEKK